MKILFVCIMLHKLCVADSSSSVLARWQEEQRWQQQHPTHVETSMERDDETTSNQLFTSWNGDSPLLYETVATDQEKRVPVYVGPRTERESSPSRIRLVTRSACSCESQYDIKDLGEGHYPRYLTTSRCKPKTCQSKFHACRLIHYMVHVLKQREMNSSPSEDRYSEDAALLETPLPESLRYKWQLKPMSVAVACVSALPNRRN